MSVQAMKRLEKLIAASINAAGAHCGGGERPKPKPPGV